MDFTGTKTCARCHEDKPLTAFNHRKHSKDGRNRVCRICCSRYEKARKANGGYPRQLPLPREGEPVKPCRVCGQLKPLSAFPPNWRFADGHTHRCRECDNEYARRWWKNELPERQKEVWPEGLRRCTGCTQLKPLVAFAREERAPDGVASRCRACRAAEYQERRDWYKAHPGPLPEEKECGHCHEVKPSSEFRPDAGTSDGLHSYCRPCRAASSAGWFQRWYAVHKAEMHAKGKQNRVNKRRFLADYKHEKGCALCGEDHPAALDFHHRDGSDKVTAVSRLVTQGAGLQRLIDEMEKCDILCANCHRKRHATSFAYLQDADESA